MMERLQVDLDITEGEDETIDGQLNDSINDAYGIFYAGSMAISPYIGSQLNIEYGPVHTSNYVGMFNIGFTIFMFLFNCGPFVFSENKKFEQKLYKLRAVTAEEDQELLKK